MKNRITTLLFVFVALAGAVFAQTVNKNVQKVTDGTNNITESLAFPVGKTLSGAGTFDFSGGTLTLANGQINWAKLTATPTTAAGYGITNGATIDGWGLKAIPAGVVVGTTDAQTLTNKTLTLPIIASISNTGTLTLPTSTDTLVGRATTDTLTNKTLTSPAITTPTGIVKGDVGLGNVDNTSDATKNAASATLTNHTLDNSNTVTLKDTLFTVQNAADTTKQARFQLSGLTTATTRTYTLPDASDTIAALAAAQTLTNKSISGATNTLTAIGNGSLTNSSISIAGTATSLGGSIALDTITGVSSNGLLKRTAANTLVAAVAGTEYEVPLTFSTGLTRTTNTVTVNTSQNIATLSNLTTNGFVKTGGGVGTLSIDTSTYLTGNQTVTLSGDVTGSGATAITTTIANAAVTLAKMANIDGTAAEVVLGRSTASSGTPELLATTGTRGSAVVLATSPTLVTPTLGAAGATSLTLTGTAGAGFVELKGQASAPSAPAAGSLRVYSETTQGFTRLVQDNEGTTNLTLGRDDSIICKNTSVGTITKGSVVYVTGSTGNVPNVSKAQANSGTTLPALGVVVDDIANNAFGQVMTVGIISNFDTSAFTTGSALYVSSTVAGGLTATRPSGTTNLVQAIATVLVSGVGNGSIKVAVAPSLLNAETGTKAATWTASAIQPSSIELGNASDTTLTRVSAGVIAVEGATVYTQGGALGTPASGVATNLTGTAAGLTAGTVTTNANLTGDLTSVGNATTLATVNSNVGSFGSATQVGTFTVNGKGLITAAANTTVTPAVGSLTGLGTGVATALGVNVGTAGAFVVNGGALGTPTSGLLTNCTGYTTANLSGTITNAQLAGSIAASKLVGTDITTVGALTAGSIGSGFTSINAVPIGATTPSTGAFTTLSATGNSWIGASGGALRTINLDINAVGTNDSASLGVRKKGTGFATVRMSTVGDATGWDINYNFPSAGDLSFTDLGSSGTIAKLNTAGFAVTGAVTATTAITSSGATNGIGYATGAGGTVTQATSRTTGVTLNTVCGAITLVSAAGSASYQSFTVTDSAVAATDVVRLCQKSGTDKYILLVTNVAAGSFQVTYATTGGTTTEQPVFNFAVLKAVSS